MNEFQYQALIDRMANHHELMEEPCQSCGDNGQSDYSRRIRLAETFARFKHQDQWWGKYKYSEHLFRVAALVAENTCSAELICAAWLHDIIEDCKVKKEELLYLLEPYGDRTVAVVEAVTNKPGVNRAKKHRNTYPGIPKVTGATLVKLCDRIINVELSGEDPRGGLLDMYRKEQGYFEQTLRVDAAYDHLWQRLRKALQ